MKYSAAVGGSSECFIDEALSPVCHRHGAAASCRRIKVHTRAATQLTTTICCFHSVCVRWAETEVILSSGPSGLLPGHLSRYIMRGRGGGGHER